jgi:hypothetical protein
MSKGHTYIHLQPFPPQDRNHMNAIPQSETSCIRETLSEHDELFFEESQETDLF